MNLFIPRIDILPREQAIYWPQLRYIPKEWVLYGGTALALRRGHRKSVDFDFFSNARLNKERMKNKLPFLKGDVLQDAPNTWTIVTKTTRPVKFSFFGGLTIGRVADPERASDNHLNVASLLDLAAQKVKVITARAESKDYKDIAELIRSGVPLATALGAAKALYPDFEPMPSLRALCYFKDGDLKTLPKSTQTFLAEQAASINEIPRIKRQNGIVPLI